MKWLRRLPEAPVTSALIAANLAIFVWMVLVDRKLLGFDAGTMIYFGANVVGTPQDVSHWRWVTAAFVHFHIIHIGMNVWVLGQMGLPTERVIGSGVVAATYIVTGVLGNIASTVYRGIQHAPGVAAGASGAVMGLIGVVAAFAWRTKRKELARSLLTYVGILLVAGYFNQVSNVDNAAHLGGFIGGVVIGLYRARWSDRPVPRGLDRALVGASFAVAAAAFLVMRSYHGYR